MIKLDKNGWPIHMPIPLPQHWCGFSRSDQGRGCLAGWIEHVFSGGKSPYSVVWSAGYSNAPDAAQNFSKRIVKLLGLPKDWYPVDFDKAWRDGKINGKRCTQAWEQAAAEFGYTEDVC